MSANTINAAARQTAHTTVRNISRHCEFFAPLESRQHMAVDLTGSASLPLSGLYAPGDQPDVKVSMTQKNDGGLYTNVPVMVTTYLSKDTKFGNGDDVQIYQTVFLINGHGKTQSRTETGEIPSSIAAGKYYVVSEVNNVGVVPESNTHNNISFSKKQDVTIVGTKFNGGDIVGTSKNDSILIRENSQNTIVSVNGKTSYYRTFERLTPLNISTGKGNDTVKTEGQFGVSTRLIIDGGAGNDTLFGGKAQDSIIGGSGNDKIYGQAGDDTLNGGSGNDYFEAGSGLDQVDGGTGKDTAKKLSTATFSNIESLIK